MSWIWRAFHQIHHSPTRIETSTAFYKHPVGIAINSTIASSIVFLLLGGSYEAAGWYNVFAAGGEMFYHSNLRNHISAAGSFNDLSTTRSITSSTSMISNFGDITWWDRLFGTFKDTNTFAPKCGFLNARESQLGAIFLGKDVYHADD